LADASVISPELLASILSQLPSQTPLHAPLLVSANANPPPSPVSQMSNLNLNEKQTAPYNPVSSPAHPPPAYGTQHAPVLQMASALYAYTPTDLGDLAIQPNDRISVLEHMNSDCQCLSFHRRRLLTHEQGGEGGMKEPVWRVYFRAATSAFSTKRAPYQLLNPPTMEIYH
jgi:hypothetical protein